MKQNKLIAITGGIGSGKSTVSNVIKNLGFSVLNCDNIYADLLKNGDFTVEFLREFGNVFNSDGCLDRKKLSEIVFKDKVKLNKLNEITHKKIMQKVFDYANEQNETCFVEVPLLFESNLQSKFDDVIIVMRNSNDRVFAVSKRDNLSEEQVKLRIDNQFDYNSIALSDYKVIINDGSVEDLTKKIKKLINEL